MNRTTLRDKLQGAIIGRFAGCALGAPVELMEIGELHNFVASVPNQEFPPTDYFLQAPNPYGQRYLIGKGLDFTREAMSFLSTDDDIAYTLLSLLMLEQHGASLTTEDVAKFWLKYLPLECTFTAERTTLRNLMEGIDPTIAAEVNNPESDYIGAAIRIDGYGYVNPGNPAEAARLAANDAWLSHRDEGLHSAMYFAALIALAFTSDDIVTSMHQALDYVPTDSRFHRELTWALTQLNHIHDYTDAHRLVTERYPGMSWVHALNNACLTVFGIHLGQSDFTKGIGETVAMAYDNDCTAATVGSVLGAYLGIDAIASHWYVPWKNTIKSYLKGMPEFKLDDVMERFLQLANAFLNTK